jgi:peptide/nickel transport system substrate-binding protein
VHPVEKIVVMKRFADFPDAFSKWAKFGVPMVAEVDVVGENRVRRSVGTTFTVNISFENKPYAMKDIDFVKYMVFDSKDNLVIIGEAKAVKNGQWSVALTPQQAAKIPVGTARIEVAVAAIPVSIPSFDSLEFVVLP